VVLIASALTLGFVHGLGADHLMAIAALAGRGDAAATRSRAIGVAVRFAIGHAVLLGLGSAAAILAGWSIPLVVERGGEIAGGSLLIALGVAGLWAIANGRVYGHVHPPTGWHLHLGRRDHHPVPTAHTSVVPTLVGAAFAVSSLRALTLLAPFGGQAGDASLPALVVLIALFAVGILLSMTLFGVALARVMSTRAVAKLGRAAGLLTAVGSIALGVYWIISAA
jgi:nickel/cobalt transporter (NicO) family protein